jgi:uncharacterized membrane protein
MERRFHPLAALNRLRSTYWFLPSMVTIAAAIAAQALIWIDRAYGGADTWLGWAYGGGADGARALLSAIAGSAITVVSVTFSVLVVALTVSSQHFGPRLLTNFMRDTPAQLVLGTFTGMFAYCLMVLRTVQGDGGDRFVFFVPHLAITGAVALTLFSVGMLIYYVHHVAVAMQVSEITARVASDFEQAIERMYPERLGEGAEPPEDRQPEPPRDAIWICSPSSGYIQEIDSRHVFDLATTHQTLVWLTRRPGDFVIAGMPIAAADPAALDPERLSQALCDAYIIGTERTSTQDAAFAIQQLVEVALRALSPGVNEPFTAITCVDRLGQGFTKLLTRRIPSPIRTDDDGHRRVIALPRSFHELACEAFEPIALNTGGNHGVAERLLDTLEYLVLRARRSADRRAISRVADVVFTAATDQMKLEVHASSLAQRRNRIHQIIARSAA